jgi:hypothetical protein
MHTYKAVFFFFFFVQSLSHRSVRKKDDENIRSQHLLLAVLLGRKLQEINHPLGVSPLIVVPSDQLDKVLVQLNARLGIKDGRGLVANEIRGHHVVFGISNDAFEVPFGGLFDGNLDFFVTRALLDADD